MNYGKLVVCIVNPSPIRIQLTVAWSARSRLFISPDRQTSHPKTSQWNVSTIQIPKHQVSDIFSRYTVIHYQAVFSDTDIKGHINIYIYISRIIKDAIWYIYIVESNREFHIIWINWCGISMPLLCGDFSIGPSLDYLLGVICSNLHVDSAPQKSWQVCRTMPYLRYVRAFVARCTCVVWM